MCLHSFCTRSHFFCFFLCSFAQCTSHLAGDTVCARLCLHTICNSNFQCKRAHLHMSKRIEFYNVDFCGLKEKTQFLYWNRNNNRASVQLPATMNLLCAHACLAKSRDGQSKIHNTRICVYAHAHAQLVYIFCWNIFTKQCTRGRAELGNSGHTTYIYRLYKAKCNMQFALLRSWYKIMTKVHMYIKYTMSLFLFYWNKLSAILTLHLRSFYVHTNISFVRWLDLFRFICYVRAEYALSSLVSLCATNKPHFRISSHAHTHTRETTT